MIKKGEVWSVDFPLEEDDIQTTRRPVIVIDEYELKVLSVKVTKHEPRKSDEYDTPIEHWKEANLNSPSTARVSKTILLKSDMFKKKIGDLHEDDLQKIESKLVKFFNK